MSELTTPEQKIFTASGYPPFANDVLGNVRFTATGEVRDAEGNLLSQAPYSTEIEMTYGEFLEFTETGELP